MPLSAAWVTPSTSTPIANTAVTPIASAIDACHARNVAMMPLTTTSVVIRPNAAPMPTLPIAFSPRVFFSSTPADRSTWIGSH